MASPYVMATLLLGLGLGTTIVFSSSHWLLAWMGLEMSTLAMVPLMARQYHPRAVEAATKYYLVQAAGATMLLFASTINAWLMGSWSIPLMTDPLTVNLITLALALKMGLAPLHSWLPEVLQGLDLPTGLMLSTWQKLAPFTILLQLHPANTTLLLTLGVASLLIGGWGGLNQTQLRKLMAYSSIAHLGWMVIVLPFSPALALLTLLTYFVMTASTFLMFITVEMATIASLATTWTKSMAFTAIAPLILLSLAGLPPLTGFMPKWLILQELIKQDLAPLAVIAALSALLSLYFYLRLVYAMTLTCLPKVILGGGPWRLRPKRSFLPLTVLALHTIMLLPLAPAMMALVAH
nr:NADH dehydrogenase subunit 2 [Sebastapistes coniorta]